MGRRGPEKIDPAGSTREPAVRPSGIETGFRSLGSVKAPSPEIGSAGSEVARAAEISFRRTTAYDQGRIAIEGGRPACVRGAMASGVG